MSNNLPFSDLALRGEVLADEIDDFVDAWHESNDQRPLYEWLGFSKEEYGLWVESPSVLSFLLASRKHGVDLTETFNWDEAHLLAARSQTQEEAGILVEWLKRSGRLE